MSQTADWLRSATGRLLAILDAEDAHRKAMSASAPEKEPMFKVARFDIDPKNIPPRWRSRMERAARDGVHESLRASIREEGWAAYAQGGLDAMHTLSDAIERHPNGGTRYAVRLDKAWDNIGGSHGNWVA
jgi:hypothetical protein